MASFGAAMMKCATITGGLLPLLALLLILLNPHETVGFAPFVPLLVRKGTAWLPSKFADRVGSDTYYRYGSKSCHQRFLTANENDDDDFDNDDTDGSDSANVVGTERTRMSDVRSIQKSFYDDGGTQCSGATATAVDTKAGTISNLPLWTSDALRTVTELPGRSTIGFVNDAVEIHMFETIVRSPSGILGGGHYVGQLKLDTVKQQEERTVRRWGDDEKIPDDRGPPKVGTLLRIVDYRRLDDGRLLLLLHAVERFVIVRRDNKSAYPVADVQIVPDLEELLLPGTACGTVRFPFHAWHAYEYDDTVRFNIEEEDQIGISLQKMLRNDQELGKFMPFVPYSPTVNPDGKAAAVAERCAAITEEDTSALSNKMSEWIRAGVLVEVSSYPPNGDVPTAADLERAVWILVDEYVRLRDVLGVFPHQLLALLPRSVPSGWPDDFVMEKLSSLYSVTVPDYVRVAGDEHYPAQRRQKRLSHAAAALLGGTMTTDAQKNHALLNRKIRRVLLEIPSTRGRLWSVRERFEAYNTQFR